MTNQASHRHTGIAVVVATSLVIPGTIVGGVLMIAYQWFLSAILESSAWPAIVDNLALLWFPSLLHGMIAGAIAILLTKRLFSQANLDAVSYSAAAVYITLGGVLFFGFHAAGLQEDTISLFAQVTGIVVGLFTPKLS